MTALKTRACASTLCAAALLALSLTGCGGGSTGSASSDANTSSSTSSSSDTASAASSSSGGSGSATLSWEAPATNTNGTALTNLAGYYIHYGTSFNALSEQIQVPSTGLTTYVVDALQPGTYYFAITSYNSDGTQSAYSSIVSKKIS